MDDDDPFSTPDNRFFSTVSWNINSVRAHLPLLTAYLADMSPDVVCLQETKAENDAFPTDELRLAGYNACVHGQKAYNGVAVLSKKPLTVLKTALPDFNDSEKQARFIETADENGVRYISVYVPNGQAPLKEPDSVERLLFKLDFLDKLARYAALLVKTGVPFVLAGDFNVIETPEDVYAPEKFKTSVLMLPEVVAAFRRLRFAGLTDSYQTTEMRKPFYSFWDYQGACFERNHGILLDYVFLSPQMADTAAGSDIGTAWRGKEKPSDHAPVRCLFSRKEQEING